MIQLLLTCALILVSSFHSTAATSIHLSEEDLGVLERLVIDRADGDLVISFAQSKLMVEFLAQRAEGNMESELSQRLEGSILFVETTASSKSMQLEVVVPIGFAVEVSTSHGSVDLRIDHELVQPLVVKTRTGAVTLHLGEFPPSIEARTSGVVTSDFSMTIARDARSEPDKTVRWGDGAKDPIVRIDSRRGAIAVLESDR